MQEVENIKPYEERGEKGLQVEEMFDSIAPAYDFMNSAMTLGMHKQWRNSALKAALRLFEGEAPKNILDIATGTGDLVFYLHKKLEAAEITGIDLSEGMLDIARKKLKKLQEKAALSARDAGKADKPGRHLAFGKADCLALPFADDSFDFITVAYGVRNFSNLLAGYREMRRVLRPGGVLCVIELSVPRGSFTSKAYKLYSGKLIPLAGRLVSGDSRAYSYLPQSIAACPQRQDMTRLLEDAGFSSVSFRELTFGAVTYYLAQ